MPTFTGVSVFSLLIAFAAPASAQSASANLSVTSSVINKCTMSTSAVSFSTYGPVVANASPNLDGQGKVTIACTKGSSPSITLGLGANTSGSVRRMANGAEMLTYELYQDSNRTTAWTDSTGMLSAGVSPSKAPRDFTVYGRVASGQVVPAGSYADMVVATVNF